MTMLTIFRAEQTSGPLLMQRKTDDEADIRRTLGDVGVSFERWSAEKPLGSDATQEDVLAAYQRDVDRLMTRDGYGSADVVRMHAEHPQRETFRAKFLDEHVHAENEVRFFVEGAGAFYIRDGERALQLVATAGDLIVVPANTRHWFDMGARPFFTAIRLFTSENGWVAQFTGDDVARRTPFYEP